MTAAGAALSALAGGAQQGANEKIGLAVIGVDAREFYLLSKFLEIEGVEIRRICDLYGRRRSFLRA